jgi:hypothetical protein
MSLTAKPGSSIDPIDAGNHHGVCVAVIDLGTQYSEMFNKSQPKIMLTWELLDFPILDEHGNPDATKGFRLISKEYTAILHEKANLYGDLVSWRGRDFTQEELEGFNVKAVLGANCLVNVVRATKGSKTYSNVAAVAKLPKGMTSKPGTYQLLYDMDESILPIPEGVPDWIKTKIEQSSEYLAETSGGAPPPDDGGFDQAPPPTDDAIPF